MSFSKRMLEQQPAALSRVAVYGSLLEGFGNHRLLEGSQKLGSTIIEGYNMYSLGAFPCIVPNNDDGRIQVEVYEVDAETMQRLDFLEGYPHMYDRHEVEYDLGQGEELAWIYFMHKVPGVGGGYTMPRIESGSWKEYRFAKGA